MAEQCHVIAIKEKRAVGARKNWDLGVRGRFWSKSRDVVRDVVEGVGWGGGVFLSAGDLEPFFKNFWGSEPYVLTRSLGRCIQNWNDNSAIG